MSKNVDNVSKNVSVLLNGTNHTQTQLNAHLDIQCDVIALTKYKTIDAGDTQTLSPHMCPSDFTLGRKSLDISSDLCPSVKAL